MKRIILLFAYVFICILMFSCTDDLTETKPVTIKSKITTEDRGEPTPILPPKP